MARRNLAAFALVMAAVIPRVQPAIAAIPSKPNILLIMADDVGADAIGCYGGESHRTPNIDRLAESGLRFAHCFSMPSCHPTRICLMTGRYPANVGNPRWGSFPRELEKHSIGRVMKDAGYVTAVAGKWQISLLGSDLEQPHRLGFDEYALFGWHEGPRYHQPLVWSNGKQMAGAKDRYGPDVYSDFLIDFMKRNRDRAFFAYFPMALCHDVTDDLKTPVPYGPRGRYDSFAEMMTEMDRVIGKMIRALEDLDLRQRTVVLFTGDNGTAMRSIIRHENGKYIRDPVFVNYRGVRYAGGKTKLTDGGTHVPLIASWPGVIEKSQTADTLVDCSDFLPSVAELAGHKVANRGELDGVSFAWKLQGTTPAPRGWVYAEARDRYWVREARWKLYNDGKFFDVSNDRLEESPLQDNELSKSAKAAKERLSKALAKARKN